MGTYKIRMVKIPTKGGFYQRSGMAKEAYVELDNNNRVCLKDGPTKWKINTYYENQEDYYSYRKDLMSGLVFSSREVAEKFVKTKWTNLQKLKNENFPEGRMEVFSVANKFLPDVEKLNYWNNI